MAGLDTENPGSIAFRFLAFFIPTTSILDPEYHGASKVGAFTGLWDKSRGE